MSTLNAAETVRDLVKHARKRRDYFEVRSQKKGRGRKGRDRDMERIMEIDHLLLDAVRLLHSIEDDHVAFKGTLAYEARMEELNDELVQSLDSNEQKRKRINQLSAENESLTKQVSELRQECDATQAASDDVADPPLERRVEETDLEGEVNALRFERDAAVDSRDEARRLSLEMARKVDALTKDVHNLESALAVAKSNQQDSQEAVRDSQNFENLSRIRGSRIEQLIAENSELQELIASREADCNRVTVELGRSLKEGREDRAKVAELDKELLAVTEQNVQLEAQRDEARNELHSAKERLSEFEEQQVREIAAGETVSDRELRLERELADVTTARNEARATVTELSHELTEANKRIDELEQSPAPELVALHGKISDLRALDDGSDSLQQQLADAKEMSAKFEDLHQKAGKERDEARAELAKVKNNLQAARKQTDMRDSEIENWQKKLKDCQKAAEEREAELKRDMTADDAQEGEVKRLRDENSRLEAENRKLNDENHDLYKDCRWLRNVQKSMERRLDEVKAERDSFRGAYTDGLDETFQEACGVIDDLLCELDAHIFGEDPGIPSDCQDIEAGVSIAVRHEFGEGLLAKIMEVAALSIVRDRARRDD